ncbi:Serine/threonine-protein phosphatase 6 regulatory ankyrin repeat subunit, partial [Globisporangium polare]
VRQLQMPSELFVVEVDRWFSLSHPHVIKLFGASHLRPPFTAVFENVVSTNLREYLSVDENRHLLWQKLHEVALGLKYLHERGVVLGNLQCSSIWIGTDSLAKISGLEDATSTQDSKTDRRIAQWESPECLRGEPATVASDIYSLAMCIVEALTGRAPWDDRSGDELVLLVNSGKRPELPDTLEEPQRFLIDTMWVLDPSKRASATYVAEKLRAFAEESALSEKIYWYSKESDAPENESPDLESCEFCELGCTIQEFLHELAAKCDLCLDSSAAAVFYVHERMTAVYARLAEAHKRPSDPVAMKFCEVLLNFNEFLRTAVSQKSALRRAKSQKVALVSNVLHREIDEVLALLPVTEVTGSIHDWKARSEGDSIDSSASEPEAEPDERSEVGGPVNLVEKKSELMNRNFQQVDLETSSPEHDAQTHQPWFIPLFQLKYNQSQKIGEGAFGAVYKAMWLGTPVVVKFTGYEEDGGEYTRRLFSHELRIWFPLNHPHVIKLYGAGHVGKRYFVCEVADKGGLLDYLKRDGNERKTWQKLYEVALGVQYLHEQNIVHNDLKCDNILIGGDERAKVMDFGLSCIPNVSVVSIDVKKQGAVQWRSPEYLRGEPSTLASDVYALGMCILEAVTGSPPWGNMMDVAVRFQVLKKGSLPLRPEVLLEDDNQWRLVEMMCAKDPTQRLRMPSVVERLHELAQQVAAASAQRSSSIDQAEV